MYIVVMYIVVIYIVVVYIEGERGSTVVKVLC